MSQIASTKQNQQPVIIVGGGVSGLTSAKCLKEAGVPILLLEGRDRLGGRAHTLDISGNNTSWIEIGAGWILDYKTNPVYHLLNDVGGEVHSTPIIGSSTRIYDEQSASWKGWIATIWAYGKFAWNSLRLRTADPNFRNMGERMDAQLGKRPKREDAYLLKSFLEILIGGSVSDMHHSMMSDDIWEYVEHQGLSMVMITGGYRHFIDLLHQALSKDEVMLNQVVSRISVTEDASAPSRVQVETSDGRTFEGSHVIVTVPLGVLKAGTITFDPPLPASKRGAIERIGFGAVEKVVMTFKSPFWRNIPEKPGHFIAIPSPPAAEGLFVDVSATSGAEPGAAASPCLVYVCGTAKSKRVAENPDAAVEEVLAKLQTLFPDTFEPPIATATSNWTSSPFTMGSYPYATVDTKPGDFTKMAEPTHDGKVLFAGDACAEGVALGYVEGAMKSGERTVDIILAEIGDNKESRRTEE